MQEASRDKRARHRASTPRVFSSFSFSFSPSLDFVLSIYEFRYESARDMTIRCATAFFSLRHPTKTNGSNEFIHLTINCIVDVSLNANFA